MPSLKGDRAAQRKRNLLVKRTREQRKFTEKVHGVPKNHYRRERINPKLVEKEIDEDV